MRAFRTIRPVAVALFVLASVTAMAAPTVPPRFLDEGQFTTAELQAARAAWARAVEDLWETRQVVNQFRSGSPSRWPYFWNPGGNGWRPTYWFGAYDEHRFENVHDVINTIWRKLAGLSQISWKMKRQDCTIQDIDSNVIVVGQIRLCDDFFTRGTEAQARILIHELSHHINITHPPRQVTDVHVAPIPPCGGGRNACYGAANATMLARDYPQHAVANPDNYAYFVVAFAQALRGARTAGRTLYPGPPRLEEEADHVAVPLGTPPTEPNTDRPGYDYRHFDLPNPSSALCRDECLRDGRCRAWTFVKPGVRGSNAQCWLKDRVPARTANSCCESGVIPEGLPRPPAR